MSRAKSNPPNRVVPLCVLIASALLPSTLLAQSSDPVAEILSGNKSVLTGKPTTSKAIDDRIAQEQAEGKAREEAEAARKRNLAENERRANSLIESARCEEARDFAMTRRESERPSVDYPGCVAERTFQSVQRSTDPQAIYLAAAQYEVNRQRSRGKTLYALLIKKFSNSPFSVKAADRLSALAAVEAIEESNSAKEHAIRTANDAASQRAAELARSLDAANSSAAARAYNACRIEVDSCYSRGGKNCYRDCNSLR